MPAGGRGGGQQGRGWAGRGGGRERGTSGRQGGGWSKEGGPVLAARCVPMHTAVRCTPKLHRWQNSRPAAHRRGCRTRCRQTRAARRCRSSCACRWLQQQLSTGEHTCVKQGIKAAAWHTTCSMPVEATPPACCAKVPLHRECTPVAQEWRGTRHLTPGRPGHNKVTGQAIRREALQSRGLALGLWLGQQDCNSSQVE